MAAFLPLIGNMRRKHSHLRSRYRSRSITPAYHIPERSVSPSPIPAVGTELQQCLHQFAEEKGIDISNAEVDLMKHDFTPDIIPSMPLDRLVEATGLVEGCLRKFQLFCEAWQIEHVAKITRRAGKHRRIS
jgi:hypothetical protein